ncbi:MAG TPA: hypothetical protein VN278_03355 [Methanosarcina sp.]|nr:hypothetical protein [Methanosarcina sp.]
MKHNTTRDQSIEEKESGKGADPELREIPLPDTGNILYTILNSLNSNIANFYTYTKFGRYISEKTLDLELLKRSMGIHRDFSALFLHTKPELVFLYPDFLEKTEKLLFRGEAGTDFIKYTSKMCKVLKDYKTLLHREGYLPDLKTQFLLGSI